MGFWATPIRTLPEGQKRAQTEEKSLDLVRSGPDPDALMGLDQNPAPQNLEKNSNLSQTKEIGGATPVVETSDDLEWLAQRKCRYDIFPERSGVATVSWWGAANATPAYPTLTW